MKVHPLIFQPSFKGKIWGGRRLESKFGKALPPDETGRKLRHHERTGRPLGDANFLTNLQGLLNRVLKPSNPGRKPKKQEK